MAKTNGNLGHSLSLLLIRLPLGAIFIAHGSQKALGLFGGHGAAATIREFEETMGIPPVFTILAMFAELGGGVGILLGCLTRLSALGAASVMAMAMYKVHWANGFFMNFSCQPGRGHGIEYNIALMGMALSLIFSGGGRWGIDHLIRRR